MVSRPDASFPLGSIRWASPGADSGADSDPGGPDNGAPGVPRIHCEIYAHWLALVPRTPLWHRGLVVVTGTVVIGAVLGTTSQRIGQSDLWFEDALSPQESTAHTLVKEILQAWSQSENLA